MMSVPCLHTLPLPFLDTCHWPDRDGTCCPLIGHQTSSAASDWLMSMKSGSQCSAGWRKLRPPGIDRLRLLPAPVPSSGCLLQTAGPLLSTIYLYGFNTKLFNSISFKSLFLNAFMSLQEKNSRKFFPVWTYLFLLWLRFPLALALSAPSVAVTRRVPVSSPPSQHSDTSRLQQDVILTSQTPPESPGPYPGHSHHHDGHMR